MKLDHEEESILPNEEQPATLQQPNHRMQLDLNHQRPHYIRYNPAHYDLMRDAICIHFNWVYKEGKLNLFYNKVLYLKKIL